MTSNQRPATSHRSLRTLKITLAYDGTRLVGWQRQAEGVSVQALLEDALAPLEEGRVVKVTGAGRTDAGVHATGQVASCRVRFAHDAASVRRALNARLPADVRVLHVEDAPEPFHARYWARSKTYAYHVLNAPVEDPLARSFVWHVPQRLDLEGMRSALASLRGQHDFKAFQAAGTRIVDTVRTLLGASLHARAWRGVLGDAEPQATGDALLRFEFKGDGFLRHMVRNLVGTIVDVGLGRRSIADVEDVLASRDRRRAGMTAPPQGLVLVEVEYGDGPTEREGDGESGAQGRPR